MQDISRAVRQMKTSLAVFANAREKLTEMKSDLSGNYKQKLSVQAI